MTTSPATRRLVLSTALAGMLTVALVACSGSAAPTSTANAVDPASAAPNDADAAAPGASTDPAGPGHEGRGRDGRRLPDRDGHRRGRHLHLPGHGPEQGLRGPGVRHVGRHGA